ncbi:hypothetical protein [Granulicella aggregans]|uniref:hypothetical protein n=1 Tax=Granulicella aggregans TaxID=474949 RepID=UPI0021DF7DB5|nr:hypothetical protein [Granulicella aggregans]
MQAERIEISPPQQTQYIQRRGGRTLYHGVRLARSLDVEPNLLVTINFWETSLTIFEMGPAFLEMRRKFVRWIKNPSRKFAAFAAVPTFLWVLENPEDRGHFHAHWLVHVPPAREQDFTRKLDGWLKSVAAKNYTPQPIHIEEVPALLGAGKYLLKGQFPSIARYYGIDPEPQGWIPGTKRSGTSKNLGPTEHEKAWRSGRHKRPENWRQGKYPPRNRVN